MRDLKNKFIVIATICITAICFFKDGRNYNTFYGDTLGYYLYLPSTFIYHNLDNPGNVPAGNIDGGIAWYFDQMKPQKTTRGYLLDQYTYGVALMESPFFFSAHLYAKMTGQNATGYSHLYSSFIKAGTLLYAVLGMLLVYATLRNYYTRWISLLTTIILFLCTNLFWFSVYQAGMSHIPLFFLYALTILLTIRLYRRPTALSFVALGLVTGLITLIRPSDIICLFIPLLYGIRNKQSIKERITFLRSNIKNLLLFAVVFIAPAIPQLFYWKAATGSYLYYSYGQQSFNWLHPRIIEGLFHYHNGWLPYAPVMIFSLFGIFCYKKISEWAWCIWIVLPIYIYVIYSWYCFNYINGLGSRPMIHMYPLLSLPLAAFIDFLSGKPFFAKAIFGSLLLFFVALNISYSTQQSLNILKSEESNMAYNYQILFHTQLRYADLVTRDFAQRQPDTATLEKTTTLLEIHYNDSLSDRYIRDTTTGDKYVYHIKNEDNDVPIGAVTYSKQKFGDARWFRFTGRFMYPEYPDYWKHQIAIEWPDQIIRFCTIENKIYDTAKHDAAGPYGLDYAYINKWGVVYFFLKVPASLKEGDSIKLFLRNMGKKELYMDDMRLDLYRRK